MDRTLKHRLHVCDLKIVELFDFLIELEATTPIEHPTSQITTAAGVNLLMKRTRTDDPEHK